jgi:hypothetical protein
MGTPFIIHKSKFITSNSKKFSKYIDYIDRSETKNNYDLYNDYMENDIKSTGLFTNNKNTLTEEEKSKLKDLFTLAKKNGSILWQDVFSFDNEKLSQLGFYDINTKQLDEKAIKEATCNAMNVLLDEECLKNSAVWSAAIHYNTDNIHVHIATVEPNPTRKRGKRKPQSMKKMKSKFTNTLVNYDQNYIKINDLIRKNLVSNEKINLVLNANLENDIELKRLYTQTIKGLPINKRDWNYANKNMNFARINLDKITKHYLENYAKHDYQELIKILNKQEKIYENVYGENSSYKDYKTNKLEDLFKRTGNTTLNEIKKMLYDKEFEKQKYNPIATDTKFNPTQDNTTTKKEITRQKDNLNDTTFEKYTIEGDVQNVATQYISKKDLNTLKRSFSNEISNFRNQLAYERLQRQIDYNK